MKGTATSCGKTIRTIASMTLAVAAMLALAGCGSVPTDPDMAPKTDIKITRKVIGRVGGETYDYNYKDLNGETQTSEYISNDTLYTLVCFDRTAYIQAEPDGISSSAPFALTRASEFDSKCLPNQPDPTKE